MSTRDKTLSERQEHVVPDVTVIEHNTLSEDNLTNPGASEQRSNDDAFYFCTNTQSVSQSELHDRNTSGCTETHRNNSERHDAGFTALGYVSHYRPDLKKDLPLPYSQMPNRSFEGPSTSGYNTNRQRNRNRSNVSISALGQSHYVPERESNQFRRLETGSLSIDEDSLSGSERRNLLSRNLDYGPSTSRYGPSTSANVNHPRERRVPRNRRVRRSSVQVMIPRAPFSRVVKQILVNNNRNATRMTLGAMMILHENCENFFIDYFNDCFLATLHAKRVTLMRSDMIHIRRVKGRKFLLN